MAFSRQKNITVYSRERLEEMSRTALTTAALRWGLTPHESALDEDLVNEILSQQVARLDEMSESDKDRIGNPEIIEKAREQAVSKPKARKNVSEGTTKTPAGVEPDHDRCWVRIASGSTQLEKEDVFLAINGDSVLVKRGHWVKLRKKFLPVLKDAIITQVEVTDDDDKVLRHVPRFNVSVRSLADGKPDNSNQLSSF